MFYDDIFHAIHRDNRYRERPEVTLPRLVTFTDDAERAVTMPAPFSARIRLGGWRLEA